MCRQDVGIGKRALSYASQGLPASRSLSGCEERVTVARPSRDFLGETDHGMSVSHRDYGKDARDGVSLDTAHLTAEWRLLLSEIRFQRGETREDNKVRDDR